MWGACIVTVKRDREIRTSTTTNTKGNQGGVSWLSIFTDRFTTNGWGVRGR
jgi:hypothetical protein